jgi:hypothetical protein
MSEQIYTWQVHVLSLHFLCPCAFIDCACSLRLGIQVALAHLTTWHCSDGHEVSHLRAARLFRFLTRHAPRLQRIACCFAADRLYGGSLLEGALGGLAAAASGLTHITLLNVDVTDAVMAAFARCCPGLKHAAVGRTESNAFGNFVTDGGITALAAGCPRLCSVALLRCYSIGTVGLAALAPLPLERLVLHNCTAVRRRRPPVAHTCLLLYRFAACVW